MSRLLSRAGLCVLVLLLLAPASFPQFDAKRERGRMKAMLDAVCDEVEKNFYDEKLRGLDWKTLKEEANKNIDAANNAGAMITAIFSLVNRLDDSHTVFLPPARVDKLKFGFEAKAFGDEIRVYEVKEKSAAAKAGLQVGDRLHKVEGWDVERSTFDLMIVYLRALRPRSPWKITYSRAGQAPQEMLLEAQVERGQMVEDLTRIDTIYQFIREAENGLRFEYSVLIVGAVMLAYVLFGGMIATTWVQIIKAVMLLSGAFLLALLVLVPFGFNPVALFAEASNRYGPAVLAPGRLVSDPVEAVSLGLALMLGTAGLPHILMRFYTVPNARTARSSVAYATVFIGAFYLMTFVLGFGAMVKIGREAITKIDAGGNMAAPLLAEAVGGTPFLGFIAAVAFATILAVVAGLALSGAATLAHDLWVNVVRGGYADEHEQFVVARFATVALAVLSILLGILFKGQNVAYMVGLAFAVAASSNFPALVLSIFWQRLTTAGAVSSMVVGTLASVTLIALSPTIQIDVLKNSAAYFPLRNPGIVSIPLAFAVAIIVSLAGPNPAEAQAFRAAEHRLHTGVD